MFPEGMVGYVQVPGRRTQPTRIRFKLADDPHPNGLSSVWLDPASGKVLKVVRWNELDPGNRLVSTVYPLHTGALGGPAHTVVVALGGLALATLGGSGVLLWWRRRQLRAPRTQVATSPR
ncbi:MAG TPA: PepSY domain-containing protein [Ramlibacter sp.]|uniref:PepSY-associated TM helix domain-containing protein n=1 Tax=Ramlibacter sp. TaxID=1917967 RepID=UPI002D7FEBAE|nr:PepSY domain-containing protein [Ramlibacter sp.]HET8745569.1 PepSY domain-containing protein [Ramlibacter sp.]